MTPLRPLLVIAALALAGCAVEPLSAPEPTLDNIQLVRQAQLPPMSVGSFTPGPGRPTAVDKTIVARAGIDSAPGGSFAGYLGDTLSAQLKGAGKFDAASPLVVTGTVTDIYVDSALPTAHARLAARFRLSRDGREVFSKELRVADTWRSEYIADIAVPDAFRHYAGLFPRLVGELLADPDFRAAAR